MGEYNKHWVICQRPNNWRRGSYQSLLASYLVIHPSSHNVPETEWATRREKSASDLQTFLKVFSFISRKLISFYPFIPEALWGNKLDLQENVREKKSGVTFIVWSIFWRFLLPRLCRCSQLLIKKPSRNSYTKPPALTSQMLVFAAWLGCKYSLIMVDLVWSEMPSISRMASDENCGGVF